MIGASLGQVASGAARHLQCRQAVAPLRVQGTDFKQGGGETLTNPIEPCWGKVFLAQERSSGQSEPWQRAEATAAQASSAAVAVSHFIPADASTKQKRCTGCGKP